MTSLTGNPPEPMRSPWSFMGSIGLHAFVLAWVALVPAIPPHALSLDHQEIKPSEKHIVWYKLSERLPNIVPPEPKRDPRPLRARAKFDQNVVAGPRDDQRPPQLIRAPAPEVTLPKSLDLPNVVAVSQPLRPPPLPFVAPPAKPPAPAKSPLLPDAPKVAAVSTEIKAPVLDLKAPPPRPLRVFTPPAQPKLTLPEAAPALPAAPEVATAAPNVSGAALPRQKAPFIVPPRQAGAPAAPAAIEVQPPAFTARTAMPTEESLVIVGLDPSKSVEIPNPPGSAAAGFSGGPKPTPKGGAGTSSDGFLEVPSLTIQGGAKTPQPPLMMARLAPTSPEALAAAVRAAHAAPDDGSPAHPAVRTTNVPDPRMFGHQVYTMAIQIPNLTSYSGSWLVWFASHEFDIGNPSVDMRPPLPLHMVSPEYIHSAMEDHVQGKVRLWAVIGKDGHVGEIALLSHLDDRLDRSAQAALAKWLFQPAVRNGVTVEVDAVFEIPFTLAPKPAAR